MDDARNQAIGISGKAWWRNSQLLGNKFAVHRYLAQRLTIARANIFAFFAVGIFARSLNESASEEALLEV